MLFNHLYSAVGSNPNKRTRANHYMVLNYYWHIHHMNESISMHATDVSTVLSWSFNVWWCDYIIKATNPVSLCNYSKVHQPFIEHIKVPFCCCCWGSLGVEEQRTSLPKRCRENASTAIKLWTRRVIVGSVAASGVCRMGGLLLHRHSCLASHTHSVLQSSLLMLKAFQVELRTRSCACTMSFIQFPAGIGPWRGVHQIIDKRPDACISTWEFFWGHKSHTLWITLEPTMTTIITNMT